MLVDEAKEHIDSEPGENEEKAKEKKDDKRDCPFCHLLSPFCHPALYPPI